MNEREREQERERERRERTCKSKIITLSPSSSPSPRGDPPTARLFVFFFSRGRRKRFYAPGEKFENFSHIRVCAFAGLRAHTYTYTSHTRGRDKERQREGERIRERVREIITERKEVFIKCYLFILLFFIIPHLTKTLNIQCSQFFLSFFLPEKHLKGETHSFSLWILTH
jgi:hypothetical protein